MWRLLSAALVHPPHSSSRISAARTVAVSSPDSPPRLARADLDRVGGHRDTVDSDGATTLGTSSDPILGLGHEMLICAAPSRRCGGVPSRCSVLGRAFGVVGPAVRCARSGAPFCSARSRQPERERRDATRSRVGGMSTQRRLGPEWRGHRRSRARGGCLSSSSNPPRTPPGRAASDLACSYDSVGDRGDAEPAACWGRGVCRSRA